MAGAGKRADVRQAQRVRDLPDGLYQRTGRGVRARLLRGPQRPGAALRRYPRAVSQDVSPPDDVAAAVQAGPAACQHGCGLCDQRADRRRRRRRGLRHDAGRRAVRHAVSWPDRGRGVPQAAPEPAAGTGQGRQGSARCRRAGGPRRLRRRLRRARLGRSRGHDRGGEGRDRPGDRPRGACWRADCGQDRVRWRPHPRRAAPAADRLARGHA